MNVKGLDGKGLDARMAAVGWCMWLQPGQEGGFCHASPHVAALIAPASLRSAILKDANPFHQTLRQTLPNLAEVCALASAVTPCSHAAAAADDDAALRVVGGQAPSGSPSPLQQRVCCATTRAATPAAGGCARWASTPCQVLRNVNALCCSLGGRTDRS